MNIGTQFEFVNEYANPKYLVGLKIDLRSPQGNAMAIVASTDSALKDEGVSSAERKAYIKEALSGNYENVLRTTSRWILLVIIDFDGNETSMF